MKVLIAVASISSELSGVQRHGFNMARALLTRPEVAAIDVVVAPWQREMASDAGLEPDARLTVHVGQMERSAWSRNRWFYAGLPPMAKRLGADVVHLAYPVPVDAGAWACPLVVTLHDLYPYEIPANFGFPKVLFNRWILRQCLRSVDGIACVSDVTQRRLGRYLPESILRKSVRIYNCVEPQLLCSRESPIANWAGRPFLLCVAQHRRNKNVPFLLRVFARLIKTGKIDTSMLLAIVGIDGPETRRIVREIERAGLSRNVKLMEGLPEAELQWCYRHAKALLAPSIVEGFGLPVVEALLAGCRVVCSDIAAFRELGGELCRYVTLDGQAEEAFAAAIVDTLGQGRGARVAMPMLAAEEIASQYVALYGRLMAKAVAQETLASAALPVRRERQSL